MAENNIVINGKEYPLHYKLIEILAERLPNEPHYAPLARAILSLQIPSITTQLIGNGILDIEDLDDIWNSGNTDLRRALLEEVPFRENLTDAQADEIMSLDDLAMLSSLADNCEDFYEAEVGNKRLSPEKAEELIKFIINHQDASLRRRLAENPLLPAALRLPLQATLEKGYLIDADHLRSLTLADVDALSDAPRENILTAANWIESVKNKKAREKLAKLLLDHPDPAVRLELAQNPSAPREYLDTLSRDDEADVAWAAKKNLDEDE